MPKYSIIWKGCTPGPIKEDDTGSWRDKKCIGGVKEVDSLSDLDEWWKDMSVSFGEEGGDFNVMGGWRGSFKDLKSGESEFKSKNELSLELDMWGKEGDEDIMLKRTFEKGSAEAVS